MNKQCPKCNITYDISIGFNKKGLKANGTQKYQYTCKSCNKLNLKQDYKNKKSEYLKRNAKGQIKRRKYLENLKSKSSCINCEENHISCLDFHHRNPSTKIMPVSETVRYSHKKMIEEIEKCDVLCANCHRKLHYNERNNTSIV